MLNPEYIRRHTYFTIEYFEWNNSWEPLKYKGSIYDDIEFVDMFNYVSKVPVSDEPVRFEYASEAIEPVLLYRREHDKQFRIVEHYKNNSRVFLEGTINKDNSLGTLIEKDDDYNNDPYLIGLANGE